jgi:hypothetical protein
MTTRTDLTTRADRRTARLAAVLFLVTWVTSVGALPLYGGSSYDPATRLAGRDSVLTASLLEVVLAVAVVGTSLALYPLLRAHGRGAALGYVALRGLEASVILVGVVAVPAGPWPGPPRPRHQACRSTSWTAFASSMTGPFSSGPASSTR